MNASISDEGPSFLQRLQSWASRARFFTFSALLHVILLVVCGSVVLVKSIVDPPDFVASEGSLVDPAQSAAPPAAEPPKLDQMKPPEIAPPASAAPNVSAITTTNLNTSFKTPSSLPAGTGRSLEGIEEKLKSAATGTRGGAMALGGTAMKFFGVSAKVQSVVFAIDVSGSMISGEKSPKTYEVLEREVVKVIRGLNEKNLFGIVVFSKDAEPYKPNLVHATNEEKDRAIKWLKRISPEQGRDPRASQEERDFHHGTRADRGLARAFEMKPDTIFFVSDGEPTGSKPPKIIEQVRALQVNNGSPAAIHTIAYLADGGQQFMKDLAMENQGTFREVNPKDVK